MGILTESGKIKLKSFQHKLSALKKRFEDFKNLEKPITQWSTDDSKTALDYNFVTRQGYLSTDGQSYALLVTFIPLLDELLGNDDLHK